MNFKNQNLHISLDSLHIGPFNHLVCNDVTYRALITNFKELGQFNEANDCYLLYRFWSQNRKQWLDFSKWIDVFFLFSCGYGVRPIYTLFASIVIIVIFGYIFKYYNCGDDPFNFSLLVFTFQARGDPLPEGCCRYIAMFEGILGLILFGLFLVSLSNVMTTY